MSWSSYNFRVERLFNPHCWHAHLEEGDYSHIIGEAFTADAAMKQCIEKIKTRIDRQFVERKEWIEHLEKML